MLRVAAISILIGAASPGLVLAQGPAKWDETLDVRFFSPATSQKQVSRAIKLSLADHEWRVEKETETSIYATFAADQLTWLKIVVSFDTSKASIAYVDGSGNNPAPEPRFRVWVANVAKEIPLNLRRIQILFD
ncbi:hypothetical protein AYO46_07505 [Betaproteobacteria bacterium SCGC AG-212-J23]|nr:hypothetical protein AYO46_07505 [Betaproteobacteria bacterium SCGC AG-212-J23]